MKGIFSMLLVLLLIMGCSQQSQTSNAEKSEDNDKVESEKEDKEEQSNKETTNEEIDEEKEEETEQSSDEKQEPEYIMNDSWSFEPIDNAKEEVVLLTFDDAPDENGLEIAKTLHELETPAIFFVNGHFINTEEKQEILKQIHDLGFPIGNHTMTHSSLPELPEEEQKAEIVDLNNQVEEITGERPRFFRAPFGQNTDLTKQVAEEEEMLLMNWTYGYDWEAEYQEADSLADIMVNTDLLVPGANLLMHDREWTAEAVPDIVEGFKEKGYDILDPELIKIN
ncbi:polysaccharide deacetylase family protein [Halobacillus andaensis]|uniref:polysaccharide deacetylase family protein n=1 Tax=Halobacillus andaensis TaxID=1176239 RepID=UPI003D72E7BA